MAAIVATDIASAAPHTTQPALRRLQELGQSIWLDRISRDLIRSGGLQRLVDEGLLGITSNPTIFEKAITGSADYDDQLTGLAKQGQAAPQIFEALAIQDIQEATDVLRPVYERLDGADGYVSLEVSPKLAYDTDATIAEAERLWKAVDRPNVYIKIPATEAGLPAIAASIAKGININVTLLFDVDRYEAVTSAYLEGLERYAQSGGAKPLRRIASVASFFVSRVDTLVDKQLEGRPAHQDLLGTAAVANAKLAYERFERIFNAARFAPLKEQGARVQRVLWASTSTKNPAYQDTKYVNPLIGPHTVNTVPDQTLDAIKDHAQVRLTIKEGLDEARAHLTALARAGIDMKSVASQLEADGVGAFAKSYDDLLASIDKKARAIAQAA
ncbi:MAG: transaldolase [Chloroflexota bacterium]